MIKSFSVFAILATLSTVNIQATASPLSINPAKSQITVTFTQMSVPVDAHFKKFTAEINYDPNAQDKTSANMTVDVTSFDLGDPEYNKEVLKPDWFNAGKFAQATFTTQSVKALSANQLQANGVLTIKGKSQNVVVPISVKAEGKAWSFIGELPIKRNDFSIGEGEWAATDMVADQVTIRFSITTNPQ